MHRHSQRLPRIPHCLGSSGSGHSQPFWSSWFVDFSLYPIWIFEYNSFPDSTSKNIKWWTKSCDISLMVVVDSQVYKDKNWWKAYNVLLGQVVKHDSPLLPEAGWRRGSEFNSKSDFQKSSKKEISSSTCKLHIKVSHHVSRIATVAKAAQLPHWPWKRLMIQSWKKHDMVLGGAWFLMEEMPPCWTQLQVSGALWVRTWPKRYKSCSIKTQMVS